MKSFLCKQDKKPICHWTMIPDNVFFQGKIPEGYHIGVSPGKGYIIVDVDRHGDKNGFDHLPENISYELSFTLNYPTKGNGRHFWLKYTGDKELLNKSSGIGIDLRFENKGYVIYYPDNDIRDQLHLIKETSSEMNKWLEELFY